MCMKNPFFLLLNEQIASNIYEQMLPLLNEIYIKYTKNRMFPCSSHDSYSESASQQPPPPRRGSSPLP